MLVFCSHKSMHFCKWRANGYFSCRCRFCRISTKDWYQNSTTKCNFAKLAELRSWACRDKCFPAFAGGIKNCTRG